MSIKVLSILLFFNVSLICSCLYDKKYPWALYWLGALIINSAVLWMMKK